MLEDAGMIVADGEDPNKRKMQLHGRSIYKMIFQIFHLLSVGQARQFTWSQLLKLIEETATDNACYQ